MAEQSRTYGGLTAEQRVAARRSQLISATVQVLAEKGEAGTTMTAICAAARLTERYFYESFAHRDQAVLAALDATCEEFAAAAVTAIESTSGEPAERVRAAIRAFVDLVQADPTKGRVAVVESSANPALRARRHELLGWFADLVADESERLYGADAWPRRRARLHGLVFIGGFAELIASWLSGASEVSSEELVDIATDLFDAVARRPG